MASTHFEGSGNLAMVLCCVSPETSSSLHGGHVDGNRSPRIRADVLGTFLPGRRGTTNRPNGLHSTASLVWTIRCVRSLA
jgi:hypothetical protein